MVNKPADAGGSRRTSPCEDCPWLHFASKAARRSSAGVRNMQPPPFVSLSRSPPAGHKRDALRLRRAGRNSRTKQIAWNCCNCACHVLLNVHICCVAHKGIRPTGFISTAYGWLLRPQKILPHLIPGFHVIVPIHTNTGICKPSIMLMQFTKGCIHLTPLLKFELFLRSIVSG